MAVYRVGIVFSTDPEKKYTTSGTFRLRSLSFLLSRILMQKHVVLSIVSLILLLNINFTAIGKSESTEFLTEPSDSVLYDSIHFGVVEKPDFEMFRLALAGFQKLKENRTIRNQDILTLIDFSKSANQKRLWIIDLKNYKVLKHSLVAHGRNTGEEYARKFSNIPESNQSSLGFYITGSIYTGKHGTSLKLHGVEKGINDNAEKRAIVMHAADYVSENFIKRVGRLGRSQGCPAVPVEEHKEIINTLANGSCLFIYYPDESYLANSSVYVSTSKTVE